MSDIRTRPATQKYRDNFDAVFKKLKKVVKESAGDGAQCTEGCPCSEDCEKDCEDDKDE